MLQYVTPALAITAAGFSGWLLEAVGVDTPKVVIPAIIFSLLGGFVAAIKPIGRDPAWGWWPAAKAILIGIVAAVVVSLALAAAGWGNTPARLALDVLAGYLGQQFFGKVDELGPAGILNWFMRRSTPPPSVVPKIDAPKSEGG